MKSSYTCPFTGAAIDIQRFASNAWVGFSSAKEGGFFTTAFGTRKELNEFLMRAAVEAPKEPLQKPTDICPYLGAPVRKTKRTDGWVAVSVDDKGRGYTTTPFWSEQHLDYFLATRAGVPPVFWNGDIKVRDRVPPPPPTAVEEDKSRREMINDHVEEVLDRVDSERRPRKPRIQVPG